MCKIQKLLSNRTNLIQRDTIIDLPLDSVLKQKLLIINIGLEMFVFKNDDAGTYVTPQILTGVDHNMRIMKDETFGPVVCIMPVSSDEEAISLMNDSEFGLTASLWTSNLKRAEQIGQKLETGTVFMNRADYLDPALCWTGCKDTGRSGALSTIGYQNLTRPKSFHLKKLMS